MYIFRKKCAYQNPGSRVSAAETALQPLIWCSESLSSRVSSSPEELFFVTETGIDVLRRDKVQGVVFSSIILISRGGMLMSIGSFLEVLSQRILAGMILVGRLGASCAVTTATTTTNNNRKKKTNKTNTSNNSLTYNTNNNDNHYSYFYYDYRSGAVPATQQPAPGRGAPRAPGPALTV